MYPFKKNYITMKASYKVLIIKGKIIILSCKSIINCERGRNETLIKFIGRIIQFIW
jgi:hypothetical protein